MLEPRGRQLLLAALRPPAGFKFDCAIGTTFSLDLIALLTTPLAFAMFDWQDDQGKLAADPASPTADPLALMESLRRCADRIHIYCQATQVKVPPGNQKLLLYLEKSVIEVQPPAASQGRQAVFHPKVWAIRYAGPGEQVRYRLLCLSRNLTFDRSWDTLLRLDGELTSRVNAFKENRPLSEFFEGLPALAIRPEGLSSGARDDTAQVAKELRLVRWELPEGVDEMRFWPMGMDGKGSWPFADRMDRLLVVAPFLTDSFLGRISTADREQFLISRTESLSELLPESLQGKWKCFTLDDGVENASVIENPVDDLGGPKAPTDGSGLVGLHAKLFIADAGRSAHIWTGSANGTGAAFGGNVEFLTELIGKKSVLGIDAAIAEKKDSQNLRSMLVEFTPGPVHVVPDANLEKADALIEAARRAICDLAMSVRLTQAADAGSSYTSTLESASPLALSEGVSIKCRPIMLATADAKPMTIGAPPLIRFGPHAVESISSFVAFMVAAKVGGIERSSDFVLNLPLIDEPAGRKDRLLQSLLGDAKTLLRFLLLLLSDDPESLFEEIRKLTMDPEGSDVARSGELLPLLEHMLRALDKSPEKLDQVHQMIEDLRKTPEGRSILPEALEKVWEPIRQVRVSQLAAANGGVR